MDKIKAAYDELNKLETKCSKQNMDYETMLKVTHEIRQNIVKLKNSKINKK